MSSIEIIKELSANKGGLSLPPGLTDAEIAKIDHGLDHIQSSVNWWRGDLYEYVARERPTRQVDDASQLSLELPVEKNERVILMMNESMHSRTLHRLQARVASVLPPEKRKPGLTWDFHAVALEECGVFEKKGEGELAVALSWLDWVEAELKKGERLKPSDLREIIRDSKQEGSGSAGEGNDGAQSLVGDLLRETRSLNLCINKVKAAELDPRAKADLCQFLSPIVKFYESINQ